MEVFLSLTEGRRKLIPCHVSWIGTYSLFTRAVFTRADPSNHQYHACISNKHRPLGSTTDTSSSSHITTTHLRQKNFNSDGSGSRFTIFFLCFSTRYSYKRYNHYFIIIKLHIHFNQFKQNYITMYNVTTLICPHVQ